MEVAFNAIGLEILNETAYNTLAEDANVRGEASRLTRKNGILHGRCWRLGLGLEVWTVIYESQTGESFYADCRPGFRARFKQKINPWIMTEFDEQGEALIHGFIEDTDTEVLFELQNLTEVGAANFQSSSLTVGLCGLAHRARIAGKKSAKYWKAFEDHSSPVQKEENIWSLCGEIISASSLKNPFTGTSLYWIHLNLEDFQLEILVNNQTLQGKKPKIGEMLEADVWLQGHIISESTLYERYEGVDFTVRTIDFWRHFKKTN